MKAILCIGGAVFVAKSQTQAGRILDALAELQPVQRYYVAGQGREPSFALVPEDPSRPRFDLSVSTEADYFFLATEQEVEDLRAKRKAAAEGRKDGAL